MVEQITQDATNRAAKAVVAAIQSQQAKQNDLLANVLEELAKDKPDKTKVQDAVKALRTK